VAAYLQNTKPHAELRRYEDWWEHDGLHFYREDIDFHALFEIVGTPRSLLEATLDDEYVRIGIAPDDVKWYLRFRAEWDETGSKVAGDFDITLPEEMELAFRRDVLPGIGHRLEEEPATTYYRRIRL
jgi:hypothetical protein